MQSFQLHILFLKTKFDKKIFLITIQAPSQAHAISGVNPEGGHPQEFASQPQNQFVLYFLLN